MYCVNTCFTCVRVCQYASFRLCIIHHVIVWVFMLLLCVYTYVSSPSFVAHQQVTRTRASFSICIINHVIVLVFMLLICVYVCLHLLHLLPINKLQRPPFLLHGIFHKSTLLEKVSMKPTFVGNFPQSESPCKI